MSCIKRLRVSWKFSSSTILDLVSSNQFFVMSYDFVILKIVPCLPLSLLFQLLINLKSETM